MSEDTWFGVSVIFEVMSFVGSSETMALYAYLPELPNDESVLNRYTLTFAAASFVSMVLYLASIVGISAAVGYTSDKDTLDDEIGTARLSQSVSFGFAVDSSRFPGVGSSSLAHRLANWQKANQS